MHITPTFWTLFSAAAQTLEWDLMCYWCCWASLIALMHGSCKNTGNSNKQWNLSLTHWSNVPCRSSMHDLQNYWPAIAGEKCERRTVRWFVVAVSSVFQAAMHWRIQRGSTTTITHRIPVQRQRCATKVRSISGGDVRGGSFFLHSLLIDCVMRQQVFLVKTQQRFGD